MRVRAFGEGGGSNRCHACGEQGHFKAKCPRNKQAQAQRAMVATTGVEGRKQLDPATEAPQVAKRQNNTVARQVAGGGGPDPATAYQYY